MALVAMVFAVAWVPLKKKVRTVKNLYISQ